MKIFTAKFLGVVAIIIFSFFFFFGRTFADDTLILLKNIFVSQDYPGSNDYVSLCTKMTPLGNNLFFHGFNLTNGTELWKTDGTSNGTVMVKDINATGSADPEFLISFNGNVYFQATEAAYGNELWKTDGTDAGTVLVKDINPTGDSTPTGLTASVSALFFSADDGVNGRELWKTDGTDAGTVMVKDINVSGSSNPTGLTVFNDNLYFKATDGINGAQLWRSDGTDLGTVMFKQINPFGGSNPVHFASFSGALYFGANGSTDSGELWKTDGTDAGTVMVKIINSTGNLPSSFTQVNGTLFFDGDDGVNGIELWKTDGTDAGTVMVKDINKNPYDPLSPQTGSSLPYCLVNFNNELYFTAYTNIGDTELWKSDGTDAGTVIADDINPGGSGSLPSHETVFNNDLYFTAFDGTNDNLYQIKSPTPTPTPTPEMSCFDQVRLGLWHGEFFCGWSPIPWIQSLFAPSCKDQKPSYTPDLFQINTSRSYAKLFFTPVSDATDYYISYGYKEGDERFGVSFPYKSTGVIDYTINSLNPNTNYSFRIRAGNGCATGDWSTWLSAKSNGRIYYKYTSGKK